MRWMNTCSMLTVVVGLLLGSCATTPMDPELDVVGEDAVVNMTERLERARIVHAELQKHPRAEQLIVELSRVGSWLNQAELMLSQNRDDERLFSLLLTGIETELAHTRTALERVTAQAAFDDRRNQYVDDMTVLGKMPTQEAGSK
jgi:hypothetical protein